MYLSRTDQRAAKINAIRIVAGNANKSLSDRSSSLSGRETAVSALLAIDWASGLSREFGSRLLNRLLRLLGDGALPPD